MEPQPDYEPLDELHEFLREHSRRLESAAEAPAQSGTPHPMDEYFEGSEGLRTAGYPPPPYQAPKECPNCGDAYINLLPERGRATCDNCGHAWEIPQLGIEKAVMRHPELEDLVDEGDGYPTTKRHTSYPPLSDSNPQENQIEMGDPRMTDVLCPQCKESGVLTAQIGQGLICTNCGWGHHQSSYPPQPPKDEPREQRRMYTGYCPQCGSSEIEGMYGARGSGLRFACDKCGHMWSWPSRVYREGGYPPSRPEPPEDTPQLDTICPQCGSGQVVLAGALEFSDKSFPEEYQCLKCHHWWTPMYRHKKGSYPPPRDIKTVQNQETMDTRCPKCGDTNKVRRERPYKGEPRMYCRACDHSWTPTTVDPLDFAYRRNEQRMIDLGGG